MRHIPVNRYAKVLEVLPILCVDVVVQNTCGEYLLIKRGKEPKKGEWWVIGGRIVKGETLEKAAIRKVKEETGLEAKNMRPIGYFELVNGANPFGLSFKCHTVSVVFRTVIDGRQTIKLCNQSIGFKFTKKFPANFYIRPFEAYRRGGLGAQKPLNCRKGDGSL